MQIIVDKARRAEEEKAKEERKREQNVPQKPLTQTVSAGIRKKFPTCTLKDVLFPQKYEKLTLLFYLLVAPFMIGHIFLFTYVSHFSFSVYQAVTVNSNMFLSWCIGYEMLAILFFILLTIFSLRQSLQNR